MNLVKQLKQTQSLYETLKTEISNVIVGQDKVVDALLMALLSRGHALLVGVPGLAKTLMIKSFAEALDLTFKRIQFTPDLMPSDITGTEVIEEDLQTGRRKFRFIKGPIFGNIILADEINRTPPKTQAALLEAMQEYHVTSGGILYGLEPPFFVLATQNPIEQEGTYPLPEAQLDRFMFQINVGYPTVDEEEEIVKRTTGLALPEIKKVVSREDLMMMQDLMRQIPVSEHLVETAVKIVRATRPNENGPAVVKNYVKWGAGPRASQYLIIAAKTRAALQGKATAEEKDLVYAMKNVLRHRILLNFKAEAENMRVEDLIDELMKELI
ncbi:MAG TPA: MoxR family ATPase [Candidatus Marinimicrobia bacterium]|nr:MoxR family ATPase [Candidatus Neomarinimicrobiota bacterium]